MTETNPQLRPLFEQLLAAHRSAREMDEHEVSFHALSAAVHAAERLRDETALAHVAQLSRDELAWITKHDPSHRLAAGVATRDHRSMFEQLAITATAMQQRIRADRVIEDAHETMQRTTQP